MKKKIVYWLCERGLLKIARRISPSLVSMWQGELLAKKIRREYKFGDGNNGELCTGVTKNLGVAKRRGQQFPQFPIC